MKLPAALAAKCLAQADRVTQCRSNDSPKPHKYHAQRTEVDSITFASKLEARRYIALKLEEAAGEIFNLELQPKYDLIVNGVLICRYVADFKYLRRGDFESTIEDTKGVVTPECRLKLKLMKACLGITVRLVRKPNE